MTALRRDRAGGLWVATDGGGLHHAQVDTAGRVTRFERWGVERGLLNDGIMAVEEDDDGSLWLSTRHGLSRLDPAKGRVVNHVLQSGLPVSHFNTGASSADTGFVHFGSVEGLVSIPKGTPLRVRPPSPVRITGIERLASGAGQQLSPGELLSGFEKNIDDGLAVEFAVLDFAETPHDYEYRLHPQDDWTSLGRRRQVTFFDLAPGHYRFEVRGRDVFGQWSASPPLEFDVVPPFWMTLWFRGLALAAIAMLMLGLHLVRLRSLRQRNAVLEQLESQREQALARARRSQAELEEAYAGLRQLTGRLESAKEDERSRISRELHDEFGQTLTAAKINLQILRSTAADATVAQRLEDSVTMVDSMIRQARDIARGLRPPLLDEAGLVPALDHHLKSLAERSGLQHRARRGPRGRGRAARTQHDRVPRRPGSCQQRVAACAGDTDSRHAACRIGCAAARHRGRRRGFRSRGRQPASQARRAPRAARHDRAGAQRRRNDRAGFAPRLWQPHRGHRSICETRRRPGAGVRATVMITRRRILLADDHALVRAGIRALLESLPGVVVVGETGDGLEAVDFVRRDPPDAILLDITLPGLNGLDAAARIARLDVPTRVLMLSMHASAEYAARAFAAGAAGYLNKDSAFDELATALDEICAGRRYLCRAIDAQQVQQFERRAGTGESELDALTPRQRQILQLIVEGLGTRQMAERLFLSVKTVESHRIQMMQRLGIFDVPGLVRCAIRNGLVPPEST